MKRNLLFVSIFGLIIAYNPLYSQGRWHHKMYHNYNPATVQTITGEVIDVTKTTKGWGKQEGLHATVKTSEGTVIVLLGPAWFFNDKMTLAKGDKLEVVGSKTTYDGKSAIVAKEVKSGGKTVILRNNDGSPIWAGKGMRWK